MLSAQSRRLGGMKLEKLRRMIEDVYNIGGQNPQMYKQATFSEGQRRRDQSGRNRAGVLCAAASLLWCAWGYSATGTGGQGLVWTTAFLAAVALALPRPLPGTSRWVIWVTLALTVVCMAANVERLPPPDAHVYQQAYLLDRVVTVAYGAIGISALFFRMSPVGVTKVLLGTLPMGMLAVNRLARAGQDAAIDAPLYVWVLLGLVALLELLRQEAAQRARTGRRLHWRERLGRGAWVGGGLLLALFLSVPVERGAFGIRQALTGVMLGSPWDHYGRRESELALWRSLPEGFGGRTRLLLLARAPGVPGYLREDVFTTYERGRWLAPEEGQDLTPLAADAARRAEMTRYPLASGDLTSGVACISFEILAPRLLTAIALPGNAVVLHVRGDSPTVNADGVVRQGDVVPERYTAELAAEGVPEAVFPLPDPMALPEYLAVPAELESAVSNWVAACPGLADAATVSLAARAIETYFAAGFGYRTDVRMASRPDPLIDFMRRREGFCVHFASAAALMLRSRDIPARVVGGYLCSEWAPWLKRWVVRERQGHAWVEAWDSAAEEWFLVEPTPSDGLPQQRPPGLMRRIGDLFVTGWKRLVELVAGANFLQVLADAGGAAVLFIWTAFKSLWWVLALLAGVLPAVMFRRRRARDARLTPEAFLRAALTRTLRQRIRRLKVPGHLHRAPGETWDVWLERLRPELAPEVYSELQCLTAGYQALRYRAHLDLAAARDWIAEGKFPCKDAKSAKGSVAKNLF